MVAAVTTGAFAAMANFDLPLRYWPLLFLPAALIFALLRWQAWRNRRKASGSAIMRMIGLISASCLL
ncbi:hypothetical protein ACFOKF_08315 [Sphingobium rhizovicinum]|uniref:Uncharacterized protein n=1 Tax=Sphingobium rhizovicinum TaxID=432308 RepID=A0ABV7NCI4_9SPHN